MGNERMEILEFQWHTDCFLKCKVNNWKETPQQSPHRPHAFPHLSLLQNTTQPRSQAVFCLGRHSFFVTLHFFKVKVPLLCPTLCDPMDIQSMEFPWPEYWSGEPFPSPGDLPKPGIERRSLSLEKVIHCMIPILPHSGKGKTVARIKNSRGFFSFCFKILLLVWIQFVSTQLLFFLDVKIHSIGVSGDP